MRHVGNDAAVINVKKITIKSLKCHTHVALEIKYINNIKNIKTESVNFQTPFLYKENPALDAGFRERYAFDQKSSNR